MIQAIEAVGAAQDPTPPEGELPPDPAGEGTHVGAAAPSRDAGDAPAADPGPAEAQDARLGPGEALDDEELRRRLAALLFAADEPLGLARLVLLLERPDKRRVQAALERLAQELETSPVPIVLKAIQGGYRLFSDPDLAAVVARLQNVPKPERISSAALETLAIVAYRQPVTKAEIEAIRGVQSGPMLRTLVDRGLVRVTGRADQPGGPLQYGTTREFLDRFGLASPQDLPRDAELAGD